MKSLKHTYIRTYFKGVVFCIQIADYFPYFTYLNLPYLTYFYLSYVPNSVLPYIPVIINTLISPKLT